MASELEQEVKSESPERSSSEGDAEEARRRLSDDAQTRPEVKESGGESPAPAKTVDREDAQRSADAIFKACDGFGTDEESVFKALEGKSRAQIEEIKRIYQENHGVSLENELKGEMSGGDLQRALSLLNGERNGDRSVDASHLDIAPIDSVIRGNREAKGGQGEDRQEKGWLDTARDWVFGEEEPSRRAEARADAADTPAAESEPGLLRRMAGYVFSTQDDASLVDSVHDLFVGDEDEKSGLRQGAEYVFSTEDDASLVDSVHDFFVGDQDEQSGIGAAFDYVTGTGDDTSLVDAVHDFFVGDENEKSFFGQAWDQATDAYDYVFSTGDEGSLYDDVTDFFLGDTDEQSIWSTAWDYAAGAADYVFSTGDDTSLWDDVGDWFVGDEDETGLFQAVDNWVSDAWGWTSENIFSLDEGSIWDDCSDFIFGDEDEASFLEEAGDWLFGEDDWFSDEEDVDRAVSEATSAFSRAASVGDVDIGDVGALQDAFAEVQALAGRTDDPTVQGHCAAILAALGAKISDAQSQVARDEQEGHYGDATAQQAMSASAGDLARTGHISGSDRQLLERSYERLTDIYKRKEDPEYVNVLSHMKSILDADNRAAGKDDKQVA